MEDALNSPLSCGASKTMSSVAGGGSPLSRIVTSSEILITAGVGPCVIVNRLSNAQVRHVCSRCVCVRHTLQQ